MFFEPIGKTRWPPLPLIGWDIFDFSSETAEWNSTKLDRKQDLNALYQVCVFWVDRKNKMAALASDWLRHFRLLLWNRWTKFNKTWQEARSQCPLPSLCFFGPIGKTRWPSWPLIGWDIFDFSSETAERNSTTLDRKQDPNALYQVCVFRADKKKQDGRPGLWLAETFSTSSLKPLNGIQQNLAGSKISTPSTKFVFFEPIRKTRWPPWPLIGWDIFDFSSETAERNSTKLDRKQDPNALYQVCVFRADKKKQDGRPGLWLAETFSTSPLKPLNGIQPNLTGSKISTPSTKFVFFEPIGKTRWPPLPLIGWDIFDFSSETAEWNSTKLDRKQDLNALYQVCVFWVDRKNKMAALASDWLRHFRLLLWNRWTKFNKTWQEARSQCPLPSLCFFGPIGKTRWPSWPLIGWDIFDFSSETAERNSTTLDRKQDPNALYQVCVFRADKKKQDGRPGLWLAETFSTSSLKPLNGIQQNLAGSKISTPSTKFVFFEPIRKTRWPPWPLIGWDIFDFSSETAERNSTKLDRKQDPNALYQVCVFRADKKKQDGRPGLWLAETFSTSPLKPLNGIQPNLTGSKISTPFTKFVFFGPIKINKMAALASDWLRHFRLLLWNGWTEFNETWQEARSQSPLPSLCF